MLIALFLLIFVICLLFAWALIIRKGNKRSDEAVKSLRTMELEDAKKKAEQEEFDICMERVIESRRNPKLPSYSFPPNILEDRFEPVTSSRSFD